MMAAGRELDALIAEKVMGLETFHNAEVLFVTDPETGTNSPCPNYSTDIASAWNVRDRVHKMLFSHRQIFIRALQEVISRRLELASHLSIHGSYIFLLVEPIDICLGALKVIDHQK